MGEAQARAQKKYDANNTVQVHLKLNKKTDADIIEHLNSIAHNGGKQGYIKELIREDMKNMKNTIILQHGFASCTFMEYKKFNKGDTIWGTDCNPEEIKRWKIEQAEEAKAELAKYRCSYKLDGQLWHVEEYALEYCLTDDEGEFVEGSDYDFAEEIEN